jgi:hypothetical protein
MRLRGGTNEEKNAMESPCLALAIKRQEQEAGNDRLTWAFPVK